MLKWILSFALSNWVELQLNNFILSKNKNNTTAGLLKSSTSLRLTYNAKHKWTIVKAKRNNTMRGYALLDIKNALDNYGKDLCN